jgi:transposase
MAAELAIMPTMLRRWQRKLQESGGPADQASGIAQLPREPDRGSSVTSEKAVGIFAEMPR